MLRFRISEAKAKRIILILGMSQILLFLLVAIFEGKAMHFCGTKGENCDQTLAFFRYKAFSTSFLRLWLITVAAGPIAAVFCPPKQRETLLLMLLLVPGEWILMVIAVMAGL